MGNDHGIWGLGFGVWGLDVGFGVGVRASRFWVYGLVFYGFLRGKIRVKGNGFGDYGPQ